MVDSGFIQVAELGAILKDLLDGNKVGRNLAIASSKIG
jgi:hypothetical protein